MSTTDLLNKMTEIRALSEAAWEMAADTARDDASAAEFVEQWDAWGDHWDDAEQAIREGRVSAAIESLNQARTLEDEAGDDSHALDAIKLCRSVVSHGYDADLGRLSYRVAG